MKNCYESSIQCTPFQLVYRKSPAAPTSRQLVNVLIDRNPTAHVRASQIHAAFDRAKDCMLAAQSQHKAYADLADPKMRPVQLEVGWRILLSTRNLRNRDSVLTVRLLPR